MSGHPGTGVPTGSIGGTLFFAPSLRGLSADQADWGSVVRKEYTPSVFGYAESTFLKEGGFIIAACGDVISQDPK